MSFSKGEIFFLFGLFLFGLGIMLVIMQYLFPAVSQQVVPKQQTWKIQSIDTMKYSRDMARADLTNPKFATEAQKQVAAIAGTGANYVAIDTPYDAEFLPVLEVWVRAARAQGLHVWFRGNFSGWEGWFGYSHMDEQTHIDKTKQFILDHQDIFADGDIFSSCPECENGVHLNPGDTMAVSNHRKFLIAEYTATKEAFSQINKKVASNYYSMNADVARAVMDQPTTQALDGIVVIDHYVASPEQYTYDISQIANLSGGQIVLGEFGAPIPDIHGSMTDAQQAEWLQRTMQVLSGVNNLVGINYWTDKGGSTAIWNTNGSPRSAVKVITQYYQ